MKEERTKERKKSGIKGVDVASSRGFASVLYIHKSHTYYTHYVCAYAYTYTLAD